MKKHLVLVGGGHAHMMALTAIRKIRELGHSVTVIGPSEYHYYSGMGPGMLGETYPPEQIRFATRRVVEQQDGRFILDGVDWIDPTARKLYLVSGETISYDVVSFNAGSYVDKQITDHRSTVFSAKPIETLLEAQKKILVETSNKKISIAIIGGGPSSAEISGNIRQLIRRHNGIQPAIRIFSSGQFMKRFPEKVRKLTMALLQAKDIEILETSRAKRVERNHILFEASQIHSANIVFLAHGVIPSPIFKKSNLAVGNDGGLLVNQYLQSLDHPNIFGGGDCIFFDPQPLDKVGVYAVRQNPVLLNNIIGALEDKPLQPFDPGGNYLLIFNLGDGQGVLHKGWLTVSGRPAFAIKDYIDRKFIRKFQAIEK